MSDLVYISKDFEAPRDNRARSLCSRCSAKYSNHCRRKSPGRGAWMDEGKKLYMETDGREGRSLRRRHSSSQSDCKNRGHRLTGSHCFIIPTTPNEKSTSTTYREDFILPKDKVGALSRSLPSSPTSNDGGGGLSPLPMSPPSSAPSSPASQPSTPPITPAGMPTRFRNGTMPALRRANSLSYKDNFQSTTAPWLR